MARQGTGLKRLKTGPKCLNWQRSRLVFRRSVSREGLSPGLQRAPAKGAVNGVLTVPGPASWEVLLTPRGFREAGIP